MENTPCKWTSTEPFDGICLNVMCPARGDYCPVPDMPGVCRHEERTGDQRGDTD